MYERPPLAFYQENIIDSPCRYTVTEGATKTGKTVSHLIWLFELALQGSAGQNYWWVAPVYQQAEIAFRRLKRAMPDYVRPRAIEKPFLIELSNGARIGFMSAEKPDNLYGEDVFGVVMDEYTRMREEANHAIRSTLTATQAPAKYIGNVRGTGWGYGLARKAESGELGPEWQYFKVTADDAVKANILPQSEIDDAKNTLPNGVFLELYYCIPDQSAADRFAFAFDESKHVASCQVNPQYPVHLSFDFNYNPISCAIVQHYDGCVYFPHMIKLPNSNIYQLCDLIKTKYPGCMFIVTGDATGKANTAITRDNLNYYMIIKQQLGLGDGQMQVPTVNPSLAENQVLVNAILEHYKVRIDPDNASGLVFDMKFVKMDNNGKIVKTDRSDPTQQADALDTARYWFNQHLKHFVKFKLK